MNRRVIYLNETDSTNNVVRNIPLEADDDMVVAVADYQTAGRGQGANKWESERGKNLLFSVKICPVGVPVPRQFVLSMAMALAIKKALDGYAGGFALKWPNDIYWNNYKISGTLIETSVNSHGISSCIFGVGIDVNQHTFVSDAPNPISLCSVTGHDEDRNKLLYAILNAFTYYYDMIKKCQYGEISALYHASLYRRTGNFRYCDGEGSFCASIVKVEDDGHLILLDDQGRQRRYAFKEVSFTGRAGL